MDGTTRPQKPYPSPYSAPVAARHAVHGLIAIARGLDYCLCGNVWPCPCREVEAPHTG